MNVRYSKIVFEMDERKTEIENLNNFPEVIDGKINTEEFLAAANDILRLIDKFGVLFSPIKYDMQGNIEKLTRKYTEDKDKQVTLQDMALLEKAAKESVVTIDALMWLRRALHMILLLFEKIVEDHKNGKATEDLVAFLRSAYKEALEPYHGWMAQQLFSLLSRMMLTRTQLLQVLTDGQPDKNEYVIQVIDTYLINLRKNVLALKSFYLEQSLEDFRVV